ncbi:MAG: hypothetical protein MHM6MM_001709 [Cercozoa sp. M6MM]
MVGGGATAQRRPRAPPVRGSFPLDHLKECSDTVRAIMDCLKQHDNDATLCKDTMKAYLECRQHKGLMSDEDLGKFGFRKDEPTAEEIRAKRDAVRALLSERKIKNRQKQYDFEEVSSDSREQVMMSDLRHSDHKFQQQRQQQQQQQSSE